MPIGAEQPHNVLELDAMARLAGYHVPTSSMHVPADMAAVFGEQDSFGRCIVGDPIYDRVPPPRPLAPVPPYFVDEQLPARRRALQSHPLPSAHRGPPVPPRAVMYGAGPSVYAGDGGGYGYPYGFQGDPSRSVQFRDDDDDDLPESAC